MVICLLIILLRVLTGLWLLLSPWGALLVPAALHAAGLW